MHPTRPEELFGIKIEKKSKHFQNPTQTLRKIVQRIIKKPLHVSRANFWRRNSRKTFRFTKIFWIARRKIWILISKIFKNLDFLRILSNIVHHVCLKVHHRVLRSVYSKKIRNFFKIQETFHGLPAIFFGNVFRSALNMSAEAIWAAIYFFKLQVLPQFCGQFFGTVVKKAIFLSREKFVEY